MVGAPLFRGAQPRQFAASIHGVQRRQFVHQRGGDIEDVVVGGVQEAAARGFEVFKHHPECALGRVRVGVPHAGHSHRKLIAHRRVQAGLCHPETDLPQELSLLFDERLQFHEQRVGHVGRRGDP